MRRGKKLAAMLLLGAPFAEGVEVELKGTPSSVYVAPKWEYVHSAWGNSTKQTGSLWGGLAGYTYLKEDSWYFSSEFTYMAGILKGTAGNDPTQEYITELHGGYNLSAPLGSKFSVTPFIGMGSYIFNQSISGDNPFLSHFWFVPIGLFFDYKINNRWAVAFLGMGAPTFGGRWKVSKWRDAPTSALWEAEAAVIYSGSLPFEFVFGPVIKGWSYRSSGELIEQTSTYYGLKASFEYRF